MKTGDLGKEYQDREVIFRQGDRGDCMYVIQEGKVEIYLEREGREVSLRLCRQGDFLGEMGLFTGEERSASARCIGPARLLTVDKKNFLRRVRDDPTIAFRLVQDLIERNRCLTEDVAALSNTVQSLLENQLGDKAS